MNSSTKLLVMKPVSAKRTSNIFLKSKMFNSYSTKNFIRRTKTNIGVKKNQSLKNKDTSVLDFNDSSSENVSTQLNKCKYDLLDACSINTEETIADEIQNKYISTPNFNEGMNSILDNQITKRASLNSLNSDLINMR